MKIVECHYYHIVSKITLCSLIIIILMLSIDKILIVSTIDFNQSRQERTINLFYNTFETDKIFSVLLSSFVFGFSFTNIQDSYRFFILINGVSREKYFLTKIITIFLIISVYTSILLLFSLVILIFSKLSLTIIYLKAYLSLYIMIIFYGLLSTLLIQLFNNYYLIILPFALYIFTNSLVEENKVSIFITINESGNIKYGLFYGIFIDLLMIVINMFIYIKRDLPTH